MVFVVYYDEFYPGFGNRGGSQRKIDGVYVSSSSARERVRILSLQSHVEYADFDSFELVE